MYYDIDLAPGLTPYALKWSALQHGLQGKKAQPFNLALDKTVWLAGISTTDPSEISMEGTEGQPYLSIPNGRWPIAEEGRVGFLDSALSSDYVPSQVCLMDGRWLVIGSRHRRGIANAVPSAREVEEIIRRTLQHTNLLGVLFVPPYVDPRSGGAFAVEHWIERAVRFNNIRIAVEMQIPEEHTVIDQLYAWGVHQILMPLFDTEDEHSSKALPAIEYAARVFPKGATGVLCASSLLSKPTYLDLVSTLVDRYVSPLLMVSEQAGNGSLIKSMPESVRELAQHLTQSKLPNRWFHGFGTICTPDELQLWVSATNADDVGLGLRFSTPIGNQTLLRLAALRRRLRVREVQDSFDSSGL